MLAKIPFHRQLIGEGMLAKIPFHRRLIGEAMLAKIPFHSRLIGTLSKEVLFDRGGIFDYLRRCPFIGMGI